MTEADLSEKAPPETGPSPSGSARTAVAPPDDVIGEAAVVSDAGADPVAAVAAAPATAAAGSAMERGAEATDPTSDETAGHRQDREASILGCEAAKARARKKFAADAIRIVEDGRLVLAFGIRHGKLQDSRLQRALLAFDPCSTGEQFSQTLVELQGALAVALRDIRPVTLYHLRRGWDPDKAFRGWRGNFDGVLQFIFVAAFVLLIAAAAVYTSWFKEAKNLVARSDRIELTVARNAYFDLLSVVWELSGRPDEQPGNQLAAEMARRTIREKVEIIREYQQRINEINNAIKSHRNGLNMAWVEGIPGKIAAALGLSAAKADVDGGETTAKGSGDPPNAGGTPGNPSPPVQLDALKSAVARKFPLNPPFDAYACQNLLTTPGVVEVDVSKSEAGHASPAASDVSGTQDANTPSDASRSLISPIEFIRVADIIAAALTTEFIYRERLRCAAGILTVDGATIDTAPISDMRRQIELLGLWWLPAIYGMLGSLMFLLRAVLNRELPNPEPLLAIQRVTLGGFSGIAVAWIVVPTDDGRVSLGDIDLSVFTIAFLIGYAIDIFFVLLARVILLLRNMAEQIGAPPPPPSATAPLATQNR